MELSQQEWIYSEIIGNGNIHTILNWTWWWYTNTCIEISWFTSKKAVPNLWRMIIPRHHHLACFAWVAYWSGHHLEGGRGGGPETMVFPSDHQWDLDGSVGVSRSRHFFGGNITKWFRTVLRFYKRLNSFFITKLHKCWMLGRYHRQRPFIWCWMLGTYQCWVLD